MKIEITDLIKDVSIKRIIIEFDDDKPGIVTDNSSKDITISKEQLPQNNVLNEIIHDVPVEMTNLEF